MKNSCFFALYVCIFFISTFGFSQKRQKMILDSVNFMLQENPKLDIIKECSELLLESHYLNQENTSNLYYARKLIKLARKNKEPEYGIYAYSIAFFIEQDPKRKAITTDSCLWYINKSTDHSAKFMGYSRLGYNKGQDSDALVFFLQALEEVKGKKYYQEEHEAYSSIAGYYRDQNDYTTAIKYAEKALQIAEQSKNPDDLRSILNDLGTLYFDRDTVSTSIAEKYYKRAFSTIKNEREKKVLTIYPVLLLNLSNIYDRKKEYDKAVEYVEEALLFSLEKEDVQNQVQSYVRLGILFKEKKNFERSESNLLKALELMPKLTTNIGSDYDNNLFYMLYYHLGQVYYSMGKYEQSAEFYSKAQKAYQSQYDSHVIYDSKELNSAYESDKELRQIKLLNDEVKFKKMQVYFTIAVIVLLSIVFFFAYKFFRVKLKRSRQQESLMKNKSELLEREKQKAEINSKLVKEQVRYQEYQRKMKELESERLFKELENKDIMIRHKNSVLEEMEQLLVANPVLNTHKNIISSIVAQERRVDSSFEDFEVNQSGFYKIIQEKSGNKLTALDLKYCNYISMKLSSKEIADLLHVEPRTVRVSKYRLKQKLGLGKEEDLSEFIERVYFESDNKLN